MEVVCRSCSPPSLSRFFFFLSLPLFLLSFPLLFLLFSQPFLSSLFFHLLDQTLTKYCDTSNARHDEPDPSLEVVDVLKKEGLLVVGLVSIFTYGFPVATEAFNKASLVYYSLTNYPTLIEIAVNKGIISASHQQILLKWRDDPANWNGVL